ncbi:MAG TPA: RNA polymerase sigma factor [Myxococcales bacterium]|nr:RNA polymerase sigma factor [Myxococcales bacterium]
MGEATVLPEELSLVSALREGDESAFLDIVGRYHGSMLRVAQVFVQSPAVAEDVVQETWLAVLEGIARFEGRSPLRSWIFRILANRARTRAQREARTQPFSSMEEEGDGPTVDPARFLPDDHPQWPGHWSAAPSPWADARLMAGETLALAQRAIDALPSRQKQVILLRDVEGCSPEEVCEALGLSDGNQRVLLHRARAAVRAALESQMEKLR